MPTIKRAESDREVSISANTVDAIRAALEAAGVEFIPENGGGAGVLLRKGERPALDLPAGSR